MVFATLGCGIIDRFQRTGSEENTNSRTTNKSSNDNKSTVDKTIEQVADGETTGIPECDEVMQILSDQMKNKDDNMASRATKDFFIGQIKKSIRESFEKNKNDKGKTAQMCKDYKVQLEKQAQEEKNKK